MNFAEKRNSAKKGAVNTAPFFAVEKRADASNMDKKWECAGFNFQKAEILLCL